MLKKLHAFFLSATSIYTTFIYSLVLHALLMFRPPSFFLSIPAGVMTVASRGGIWNNFWSRQRAMSAAGSKE